MHTCTCIHIGTYTEIFRVLKGRSVSDSGEQQTDTGSYEGGIEILPPVKPLYTMVSGVETF